MTKPSVKTKRWTRSPRGLILGVATGLAEWRGFPVSTTRLIIALLCWFSGIFPVAIIYFLLALFLPEQKESDIVTNYGASTSSESKSEKSTEDLKNEYEELKKKVEEMESEMFDREKDWDERFEKEQK